MKGFPETPTAAESSDLFAGGHLWLHELIDGDPFRFAVRADGRLQFGTAVRTFGDDVPPAFEHAARHVRERFDRAALREAVGDVESVVFFGRATHRRGVDYDWATMPNVVGVDVWSGAAGEYLRPDRVEKIYDRLGLTPLSVVAAEVRAVDFDPDAYEFPRSAWYDGPVAGVLVRDKTGNRCVVENPDVGADGTGSDAAGDDPGAADAAAFARRHATDDLFDAVAGELRAAGRPVTFEALYERSVERLVRAFHDRLFGGDLDARAVRSAVADRAGAYLADGDAR